MTEIKQKRIHELERGLESIEDELRRAKMTLERVRSWPQECVCDPKDWSYDWEPVCGEFVEKDEAAWGFGNGGCANCDHLRGCHGGAK